MVTIEKIKEILKESPFVKLYGLNEDQVNKIAEEAFESYEEVGEVYAGQ